MNIHVVQPADTINSIAEYYGVSVASLIQNNGLINPYNLVPGQTIVIVYPEQTHTVAEGESLEGIAGTYGVTVMQLLRNNPYITDREALYPGETMIISYNTTEKITTNGFVYPYINNTTLRKSLPYLTYLTVYNYRITEEGAIASYYDDTELLRTARDYGTIPLMMITTLTTRGEQNIEVAFEILTNEAYQERFITDMLNILRTKGFYGVNLFYYYVDRTNQALFENFTEKVSDSLKSEGYILLVTINTHINYSENVLPADLIDYSNISRPTDGISFIQLIWGSNYGPPAPVISINIIRQFLNHVITTVPHELIRIGMPIMGYDWKLPYVTDGIPANSLTLNAVLSVAEVSGAVIQFDEISQTPYFTYSQYDMETIIWHIVRFIDARTTDALLELISEFGLDGIGIWNIMVFYEQLWLIINSQYDIQKLIPDNL